MKRYLLLLGLVLAIASCKINSRIARTEHEKPEALAFIPKPEIKNIETASSGIIPSRKSALPDIKITGQRLPDIHPLALTSGNWNNTRRMPRIESIILSDSTVANKENPFKTGVYKGYDFMSIVASVLFGGYLLIAIVNNIVINNVGSTGLVTTLGFAFGLLGFALLVSSLICGIIGLHRIKVSNPKRKGKGFALLPIIASLTLLLFSVIILILIIALFF
jgi:hypothetical protein